MIRVSVVAVIALCLAFFALGMATAVCVITYPG